MLNAPFPYDRPETLAEAVSLLARQERLVLAGGTDVYPAASGQTLARPVLDISGMAALRGIARADGFLRIGACVTWSELRAADLPPALDALKAAAAEVGGRQIQNAGTIGGNLCNASPAADGVPPLLILDGRVELRGAAGRRELALGDFLTGPRRTDLRTGEILTAILIPEAALRGRSAFRKLGARRYLVISIAMVAARLLIRQGSVAEAALAVGACGPVATRLRGVETALIGTSVRDDPAGRIRADDVAAALTPITDIRGSGDYRVAAATELLRRAVAELAAP